MMMKFNQKHLRIVSITFCFLLLMPSTCEGWSSLPSLQPRINSPVEKSAKGNFRTAGSSSRYQLDDDNEENNVISQSVEKTIQKLVILPGLSLLASFSICFSAQEAFASTSDMAVGQKYWTIMAGSSKSDRVRANEALLDYAVGTINTQYYDNTGGNRFTPSDFYRQWRSFRRVALSGTDSEDHYHPKQLLTTNGNIHSSSALLSPYADSENIPRGISLDTREGAVQGLRWLVSTLHDPFSKYVTREELMEELSVSGEHGFLGTGAIVEAPLDYQPSPTSRDFESTNPLLARATKGWRFLNARTNQIASTKNLSTSKVANLPVITAIEPDSPAERVGLVVGDRIVSVGNKSFLGRTKLDVGRVLTGIVNKHNSRQASSEEAAADLVVAKPVYAFPDSSMRDMVVGYRQSHLRVPTTTSVDHDQNPTFGDSLVHYELLSSSSGSIFDHNEPILQDKVGYIRLTRFSKASTDAYLKAINELEASGAQSYIFDLRNNYGGKFQSALLLASSLIRDPHAILCKLMF